MAVIQVIGTTTRYFEGDPPARWPMKNHHPRQRTATLGLVPLVWGLCMDTRMGALRMSLDIGCLIVQDGAHVRVSACRFLKKDICHQKFSICESCTKRQHLDSTPCVAIPRRAVSVSAHGLATATSIGRDTGDPVAPIWAHLLGDC